ncbi:MAG: altronate dehydratase family protein [Pseudomonadota bacterium]
MTSQTEAARATPRTLHLNPEDNVVVAVDGVPPGGEAHGIQVTGRVLRGHKMAIRSIDDGAPVRKFGQIIGFADGAIAPGDHVHTHNCRYAEFDRDYAYASAQKPAGALPEPERATFEGFRRASGRTGTRNYIGILTSVNCSASVARLIADEVTRSGILRDYPNVDGVAAFVHGTGCGMAPSGDGWDAFQRTMWGYASHPNFAGILLVGLGCETFQIARMKETYGIEDGPAFQTMTIQDTGGTRATIAAGVARVCEMLPLANAARRETRPASELLVALQCGGSDGYSGITANAALGAAADLLAAHGATGVLAETPEIYGAEHLLTRRAVSREVGERLVGIVDWWRAYTERNGGSMDNNPSPGNKAGGLTTILEKSLGAAAKGGTTTLNGVYAYAERVTASGFTFMDTPGYDPVSVTGQVAGGCNVVTFTTGRGSAFGCKPSPSLKLATNSAMFARMEEDMDINCGDVLEGVSVADKGREIFNHIVRVASGARTKSEALGYGDNEFVPWQIGAVM